MSTRRAAGRFHGVFARTCLAAIATAGCLSGSPAAQADRAALERDVRALASDELQGRGLGTPGLREALLLVARRFQSLGLAPADLPAEPTADPSGAAPGEARTIAPAGDPLAGYFQEFRPAGLAPTANVIGILPGREPAPPRAVIVGAHVDHLGRDEGLTGDQIYNGADDNASGVAALLEIARLLAAEPPEQRDRTVVFIAFSAEESGLLGSQYYCAHPVVPHDEVIAMINLDGIGHMEGRRVLACGTATAREFADILGGLNNAFGLEIVARPDPVGGSDHVSFLAQGVPALFFLTGPHADYSKVSDEPDLIRYDGLALVAGFTAELARYLRYRERGLTFVAVSEKDLAAARPQPGPERRVSLGFMPDFASASGGVKVGAVTPGGAAAQAGLETGDVIVALDGDAIETLADYTTMLRAHAPGDRVTLTVRRGERTLTLAAQLQERK